MPLQLGRSLKIVSGPPEQGILGSTAGVWVPRGTPSGIPHRPPGEETEVQEADGRDQSRLRMRTWGGHHQNAPQTPPQGPKQQDCRHTGSEADDADRPWCPRLGLRTPVSSPTLQGATVWDQGIFET